MKTLPGGFAGQLASGTRLGPYEILGPLGAGGMGEVYRARDTRLERTVAIKILSHNVEGRAELFQRFQREAQTISTLNHPNICTLYDVGTEAGVPYLVMEYIEGETLSERLMRGPLPLDQMWPIAIQVGDALDQSHRRGIVHRDLKPGNVMLAGAKGSTTVKLLDFGLAKISRGGRSAAAPGSYTSLTTVAQSLTVEGMIVGTFQYMSPEQLEGTEADARSDIFAFGCVLYEMITGEKAFQGKSRATLISAILTSEPGPVTAVQPMAPPALDRVVRKCLAKNPDDRWQTARDLVSELRWISESGSQSAAAPAIARRRVQFHSTWIAVAVLATALAALLTIHLRETHPVEHTMRFHLPLPEKASFRVSHENAVLSPDATRVVFSAQDSNGIPALYVRSLDSLEVRLIPGTSGNYYNYCPFWSPDGRFIAFGSELQLKKVDLAGGNPVTLCPAYGFSGGTWNRDDVILFSSFFNKIQRVSAYGGNPTPATQEIPGQRTQAWPSFLPDGRHFLFTSIPSGGIHAGSLDQLDSKQVSVENSNAQYSSAGFLVFSRRGTVLAQPFDTARLCVTGEPTQIADKVSLSVSPNHTATAFSAVGSTLVYLSDSGAVAMTQLAWFDRKGGRAGEIGETADYSNPALSPDGHMLAVCKRDPVSGKRDIWIFDLARGTPTRLTFDPADDCNPVWSPDGKTIVFASDPKGRRDLYRKASSGGREDVLLESDRDKAGEDWTRDGRYVIYNLLITGNQYREIWAKPLSAEGKPFPVISGQGYAVEGHVSPNGKWISYKSYESGVPEIYVQDFPPSGGKWQVSTGGGREPSWNTNGKELFYLQADRLVAVDVDTESDRFAIRGAPRVLFDAPFAIPLRNAYVVSPDGQKFLVNTRIETKGNLPMTLVLNWPATLKH